MKKMILIIVIIILIFSVNVIAIDIDIGDAAIDANSSWPQPWTLVNKGNPANASGKITSVEIWALNTMSGVWVATFYVVSGNNLSTRDTHYIGTVTAGAKRTFEVDLNVETGDYIGIHIGSGGDVKSNSVGGSGEWAYNGDAIPCSNLTFSFYADRKLSVYGTGTTVVGWDHKWNTKEISKWNAKELTKWNGLE